MWLNGDEDRKGHFLWNLGIHKYWTLKILFMLPSSNAKVLQKAHEKN